MLITTLVVSFLVCCKLEVKHGQAGVVSGLQAKTRQVLQPAARTHNSLTNRLQAFSNFLSVLVANNFSRRSQQPRGLGRRSAAARVLRSWVRISPGVLDVCCDCCVLSGRGLCDELFTSPEEAMAHVGPQRQKERGGGLCPLTEKQH